MPDEREGQVGEIGGPALVLYDGDCILCSSWFRFVARRDHQRRLMFTPIQSPFGRSVAVRLGIDPVNPQSNAVLLDGKAYLFSESALAALSLLPYWKWTRALRVLPRAWRDALYRPIARNRYRWFGRRTSCDLGGADYRGRVITEAAALTPPPPGRLGR